MPEITDHRNASAYSNTPECLVCGEGLDLRRTKGRNSKKPSLMFICPIDGRHFRAFVTYQPYVDAVLTSMNDHPTDNESKGA